jgi:hypothetical protein
VLEEVVRFLTLCLSLYTLAPLLCVAHPKNCLTEAKLESDEVPPLPLNETNMVSVKAFSFRFWYVSYANVYGVIVPDALELSAEKFTVYVPMFQFATYDLFPVEPVGIVTDS